MSHLPLLLSTLSGRRFMVERESDTQDAISAGLTEVGIAHRREVRLSSKDRIDFMVDRIGIEVKVGGQKRAILRQLERYAESDEVDALVLVTNVALGLPAHLSGKALHVVSIGRGWL